MQDWHVYQNLFKCYWLAVNMDDGTVECEHTLYEIYCNIEQDGEKLYPSGPIEYDYFENIHNSNKAEKRCEELCKLIEQVNKELCKRYKFNMEEQYIIKLIARYSDTSLLDDLLDEVGSDVVQEYRFTGKDKSLFKNKAVMHQLVLCLLCVRDCLANNCSTEYLDMILRGTVNHHGFNSDGTGRKGNSVYFVCKDTEGKELWNEYNLIGEIAHYLANEKNDIGNSLKYIRKRTDNKLHLLPTENLQRTKERIEHILKYVEAFGSTQLIDI